MSCQCRFGWGRRLQKIVANQRRRPDIAGYRSVGWRAAVDESENYILPGALRDFAPLAGAIVAQHYHSIVVRRLRKTIIASGAETCWPAAFY
jgi:hypothetical protein